VRVRIIVVGPCGAEVSSWSLERDGEPDLAVVDELARLRLAAGRMGYGLRLAGACPGLTELLELAGLTDLGSIEVIGQAEEGEDARVEEGVELDDPPA
jgi:hypothetical protein